VAEVTVTAVDAQNRQAFRLIGQRDLDRSVEAARSQQGGIEGLRPVGGRHNDHVGPGLEPVHLREELVERLLPFVVGSETAVAASTTYGVDLVDEDDRRRALAGLGEQVADSRSPDTDEHLDEAGAADRKERDPGLSGDRPGQQRLPGPGRTDEEYPLRSDRPRRRITLGVREEFDDLHDLGLGALVAGDGVEPGRRALLVVELGLGLPCARHAPELRTPLPADPHEDPDEQDDRKERQEDAAEGTLGRTRPRDDHPVRQQERRQRRVVECGGHLRGVRRAVGQHTVHRPTRRDRGRRDATRLRVCNERAVGEDLLGRTGPGVEEDEDEECGGESRERDHPTR
jgi:hypothetical protein